jgi:hypothetical protein
VCKGKLFEIQPASCRQPLPIKKLDKVRGGFPKAVKRVIFYDPAPQYENIRLLGNPMIRHQRSADNFTMGDLFPPLPDKVCSCGCGEKLTGKQRRWASKNCEKFALYVYSILCGRLHEIRICMRSYYGDNVCIECGTLEENIEIDHIIPVHQGGGCCWLSNLRPICVSCHKGKTNSDRKLLI